MPGWCPSQYGNWAPETLMLVLMPMTQGVVPHWKQRRMAMVSFDQASLLARADDGGAWAEKSLIWTPAMTTETMRRAGSACKVPDAAGSYRPILPMLPPTWN